jgi:cAMP-binding proteins - catabolite gene activator and regulatory subunit of cAMP-dependent protein kinases
VGGKYFAEYFEVHDLEFDEWNNIDGLEVKPVYSPHPVETNILFFRTLWEEGYASYGHLADVASDDVLKNMLEENKKKPGISNKLMNKVWNDYLSPVQVKKIDIGGGIIHGKAEDFKDDKSKKIILAHTAHKLSKKEELIGCGETFGSTDVLIEGHEDYPLEFGGAYLKGYYPNVEEGEIHMLLNCKREIVSPGTILLADQEIPDHACLVLTGVAELISTEEKASYQLSSGTLIGDLQVLFGLKNTGIYRALSHIETLKIPKILFKEFVHRNNLTEQLKKHMKSQSFCKKHGYLENLFHSQFRVKLHKT